MSSFAIVARSTILQSFVFNVETRTIAGLNETFTRDVVTHPGAVAIVAVNAKGEVALLSQYRAALDIDNLEIPAGTCDIGGEDTLTTAQRELSEEIGGSSTQWSLIARFYNSPGWTDQETCVYLAERCIFREASPDGPEESAMSLQWKSASEIRELLQAGGTLDGTATIGLYAWLALQH
ncbi:MAG: NUDIX hydrolase [Actinobacteria bacterium]|nr:NUDIX hydrolase [Actinomycetota bacterium]